MIITDSRMGMSASSSYMQRYTQETRVTDPSSVSISSTSIENIRLKSSTLLSRSGAPGKAGGFEHNGRPFKRDSEKQVSGDRDEQGATAKISDEARRMAKGFTPGRTGGVVHSDRFNTGIFTDFRYSLLDSVIKLITGGKSDLVSINPFLDRHRNGLSSLKNEIERMRNPSGLSQSQASPAVQLAPNQAVRLNFRKIDVKTELYEEQSMNFQANGTVKTADGREISIDVSLAMSSQFYSSNEISITQALIDPLVINFGSEQVSLTQTKFDFDIDCDGKADQISFATGGSGFLAIDEGDGVIRDGNQLFGARTGDGFAELAVHDKDSNGWIDEADDIYSKLRIWLKDEAGNDRLISLGEAGVGAIYLGNVAADYNLRSDSGSLDGQIRQSGVFLYENGSAGTIHHVDIAV